MEYIKIYKLVTGEEIIAKVAMGTVCTKDSNYTYIKQPLIIARQMSQQGLQIALLPWTQPYSTPDTVIAISNASIVFELEPNMNFQNQYIQLVSGIIVAPPGSVPPTGGPPKLTIHK